MDKSIFVRFAVTFAVLIVAFFSGWPLDEKIKLGLDLKGGMHLVYDVETDKAIKLKLDRTGDDLLASIEDDGIAVSDITLDDRNRLKVVLDNESDIMEVKRIISEHIDLNEVADMSGGNVLFYAYSKAREETLKEHSVDQALETLRNRIDAFGVSEPSIQRQGETRILIQLPGVQDPERAKALINTTAMLEFKLVSETGSIDSAIEGNIPSDLELVWSYETNLEGLPVKKDPFLLEKAVRLTGEFIEDADVRIDSEYNQPYVSLTFDGEGASRFAELTGKNVKRRLAIVLDGKIHSAPTIQERIGGGRAQISGSFSQEEARDLAIVLRAGALPAPLRLLEERTIGPSLGADSVARGVKSIIFGFISVVLFMMAYYRVGGLIADFALFMNLVVMAGLMGYLEATLTLPGIAGIILTVGMAVDANVLVFERIKEEMANGKTVRAAVESGFSKAFLTIIDANITTLIAAVVLFQFGTGPLKGFAVTLTIGILASMFTAVFVSRTIFNMILSNRKVTKVSI